MEVVINNLPLVCTLVGVIGVLFSIIVATVVKSAPAGDEKMQGIASAVKEGAIAYLNRQMKSMGIAGAIIFIVIFFALDPTKAIGFAVGAVASFLAGYIGLLVHALGANTFIIVRIMEPFWFFAGIITVLPMLERQRTANVTLDEVQPAKFAPAS